MLPTPQLPRLVTALRPLVSAICLLRPALLGLGILSTLPGCGSGGSNNGRPAPAAAPEIPYTGPTPPSLTYQKGQFRDMEYYANWCVQPSEAGEQQGSTGHENFFVREMIHSEYLWSADVADQNPMIFNHPVNAFYAQLSPLKTASGKDKDAYSFAMTYADYSAFFVEGNSESYGIEWVNRFSTNQASMEIAFVEPGSPADRAGLKRGLEVLSLNGIAVRDGVIESKARALNEATYPAKNGDTLSLEYRTSSGSSPVTVTLISGKVDVTPVLVHKTLETATGKVGYMVFNTFVSDRVQVPLVEALADFETIGIEDLVLDLRYNSGGAITYANQLSYMIAGPEQTRGKVFNRYIYNPRYLPDEQGFTSVDEAGKPLPSLNLPRVFVLTTGSTCSASELVMNSLRGIGVEVIQIGTTSCGKPYGFAGIYNCGWVYFPIQFQTTNHLKFGDYADGFEPSNNATGNSTTLLPGCRVEDDFDHALGDTQEALLAKALAFRQTNSCGVTTTARAQKPSPAPETTYDLPDLQPWKNSLITR